MTVAQARGRGSTGPRVWIGLAVVVAVAGLIAVVVARGGSDTAPTTASKACSGPAAAAPAAKALPAFESSDGDGARCQPIPAVAGKDLDGNALTIGAPDHKGKILIFVAHWCPHCQREVPLLKRHLDDVPLPKGVELITISTAVRPGAANYPPKAWLEREGWPTPVFDDATNKAATAYGLTSFPYFVATDADGRVLQRASGELSTDAFDDMVEEARTNGGAP